MGINFKGYDEYYRSKVPLKFVFLGFAALAVNLLILVGIQFLTVFQYTGPVDSEMLGRIDSRFENCTILDSADTADSAGFLTHYSVYLLETKDGETHAAVLEKHFLTNRYRYREDVSVPVPDVAGEQRIETNEVKRRISIAVTNNAQITDFSVNIQFSTTHTMFLLSIAMCAVELVVYGFVFRKEELA